MPLEPLHTFALSVNVIRTANQAHSKFPSFSKHPPAPEAYGSKRSATLVPVIFSVQIRRGRGKGREYKKINIKSKDQAIYLSNVHFSVCVLYFTNTRFKRPK